MKILAKIPKTIRICAELTKAKWKNEKALFIMDILIGLFRESRLIAGMLLPTIVAQLIVDAKSVDLVLASIFAVSALLTSVSIGIELLQRSLSNHSLRALNYLILGLNKHAMDIDLATYERGETTRSYDVAYDGLWNSSDVDYWLFSVILSKLISFSVTAYIFSTVHWTVALFVIFSIVVEFVFNVRLSEKTHAHDKQQSQFLHKKNYLSDTIFDNKKNKEIFLNGAKDLFVNKYKHIHSRIMTTEKSKRKDVFYSEILCSFIDFVRTVVIYIIAIIRYLNNSLPIANFLLFSNAAKQMTYSIWQIFQSVASLFQAVNYFEDYLNYMQIDSEKKQEIKTQQLSNVETVEFRDVSYRYENQSNWALKGVSFKLKRGETLGIVGDNGAGKSTLIKLLLRLYEPTEGEILVNGESIYSYDIDEYRAIFAPVFQDFNTYSFTIRENIVFGAANIQDALWNHINEIGLDNRINTLPLGLDTPYTRRFSDQGVEFSGGEEQKMVIVRALCRDHAILILDEPTSAIDPLAEYNIYKHLFETRQGQTNIFISHRMSTTRFCDLILVLANGKLIEVGSHDDLMKKRGSYHEMYNLQTSYYCDGGNENQ